MALRVSIYIIFSWNIMITSLTIAIHEKKPLFWYFRSVQCKVVVVNQLKQKFKFMLRSRDMLYTLTRPLTQESFGIKVWMQHTTHTLLISGVEYSTLNERSLRFELLASVTLTLILCQKTNSTKSLRLWF